MLITCPSCAAEYNVPGPLAPGRVVRCARCANEWAPTKPPPAVEAPVIDAPVIDVPVIDAPVSAVAAQPAGTGVDRPSPAPVAALKPAPLAARAVVRPPPGRLTLLLAWGGSVVLLAMVAMAAVVWRDPVMRNWPPSIRVYDALGLTAHS